MAKKQLIKHDKKSSRPYATYYGKKYFFDNATEILVDIYSGLPCYCHALSTQHGLVIEADNTTGLCVAQVVDYGDKKTMHRYITMHHYIKGDKNDRTKI